MATMRGSRSVVFMGNKAGAVTPPGGTRNHNMWHVFLSIILMVLL